MIIYTLGSKGLNLSYKCMIFLISVSLFLFFLLRVSNKNKDEVKEKLELYESRKKHLENIKRCIVHMQNIIGKSNDRDIEYNKRFFLIFLINLEKKWNE